MENQLACDDCSREYSDGSKEWLVNGYHHRLYGPAIFDNDPWSWTSGKTWFICGIKIRERSYKKTLRLMQYVKQYVGAIQ